MALIEQASVVHRIQSDRTFTIPVGDPQHYMDPQLGESFNALVAAFGRVQGAPRIAPWVDLTAVKNPPPGPYNPFDSDIHQFVIDNLTGKTGPDKEGIVRPLWFQFADAPGGTEKPLMLINANPGFAPSQTLMQWLVIAGYTVRPMWGGLAGFDSGLGHNAIYDDYAATPETWSFLERCQPDLKSKEGKIPCDQRVARKYGQVEETSILPAYQVTYMSDVSTAVPKFFGETFLKQLETLKTYPSTRIAMITGWNGWAGLRFCFTQPADPVAGYTLAEAAQCEAERHPGGDLRIFSDLNSSQPEEYNYDFEPSKDLYADPAIIAPAKGDYHYQLMRIALKTLQDPDNFYGTWPAGGIVAGSTPEFSFGLQSGDVPFVVQLRPNEVVRPTVFRKSNATWYVNSIVNGSSFHTYSGIGDGKEFQFGLPGDIPFVVNLADICQMQDCPVVFRPANGTWYVNGQGFESYLPAEIQFGGAGDQPLIVVYQGQYRIAVSRGGLTLVDTNNKSYFGGGICKVLETGGSC